MNNSIKKTIYVLLPLLIYVVVHDFSRLVLMYLVQIAGGVSEVARAFIVNNDSLFSVLISIIDSLLGAWAVIFLMKRDPEELALEDYLNLNGISFYRADRAHPAWLSWLVIGVQGVTMAIGLNMLFTLVGISSSGYAKTQSAQYSVPILSGVFFYGLVSPLVEELLFRIVIYGRMKRCFPYVISMVVSSLFFGLYHRNVVQGIYGTIMGIVICIALEYVHSIVGAFMIHSLVNISVYLLSSINVFGTEGNITLCSVFLGTGILLLAWEIYSSISSKRKYGVIEGILPVGCFYVDESLYDEE